VRFAPTTSRIGETDGSPLGNTTSTARNDAPARCLIAIELSKASWVVGVQTPLSHKTSQYRLTGGDWESLLKLIERIGRQVGRELGRPVEMISCYEAGYDGFWLHRLLEAMGCAIMFSIRQACW